MLVNLLVGFLIGLALGLLGGGGSILTVPALVYLVGQSPQAAVTASLAIVGMNSLVGAALHVRRGLLHWQVSLLFGGAGMLAAYLAAGLSSHFPPATLMVAFALLMLVVGAMMLRGAPIVPEQPSPPKLKLALVSGVLVGLLTGVLGVGGGFLIVPALVLLVGLPIKQAVGTSLAIISANSFAGLLGHLQTGPIDMRVLGVFMAAGAAGTYAGMRLGQRMPARRLRQAFAVFVILLGLLLMVDYLPEMLLTVR